MSQLQTENRIGCERYWPHRRAVLIIHPPQPTQPATIAQAHREASRQVEWSSVIWLSREPTRQARTRVFLAQRLAAFTDSAWAMAAELGRVWFTQSSRAKLFGRRVDRRRAPAVVGAATGIVRMGGDGSFAVAARVVTPDQPAVRPSAFTIGAHLPISPLIISVKSCGVPPNG